MKICVAIHIDEQGRVSVGEIPADQVPALQPARDVDEAVSRARTLLSGTEQEEERAFEDAYETERPRLPEETENTYVRNRRGEKDGI